MKIAIVGDMHLGIKGADPAFMDFQLGWIKRFIDRCVKEEVERIVQVGDMLDVRNHTSNLLIHRMIHEFIPMVEISGIPWTILVGNHNIFYRDNNAVHNLCILKHRRDLFHIVEGFEKTDWGDVQVDLCGWLNKNNSEEILQDIARSSSKFLFGHFEPEGLPYYKGLIAEDGIDLDLFSHYENVFSGHYHTVSNHKNFLMCGSPFHLTWADQPDGTDRGFFILNLDDDSIEMVNNEPGDSLFAIVQYDKDVAYNKPEGFNRLKEQIEGKIVKMLVSERGTPSQFKGFKEALSKIDSIDYNIIDTSVIEVEKVEIKEEELHTSTLNVFQGYIDKQEWDESQKSGVKVLAAQVYDLAMKGS